MKRKYYCKDCGKEICRQTANYGEGRCSSCMGKFYSIKRKEEGNPNHKHGMYHNAKCVICNNKVSYNTWAYGEGKCQKCEGHSRINKNKEPYPSEFTQSLKDRIRERDNYECQNCHMTEEEHIIVYGRVLDIHHIDYNKENCNENNLITTCKQCNNRANYNRKYWQNKFNKIMRKLWLH